MEGNDGRKPPATTLPNEKHATIKPSLRGKSPLFEAVQGLQAASSKFPLETVVQDERNKLHERNVSWDPSVSPKPGGIGDDDLGDKSPLQQQSKWSKVNMKDVLTLKDVMSVSPVETEAETLIMKSLDEYDPTKTDGSNETETILLSGVPTTTNALSMSMNTDDQGSVKSTRTAFSEYHNATTAAEKINVLAQNLRQLHGDNPSVVPFSGNNIGPTDAFVKNATKLMDVIPDAEDDEEDEEEGCLETPLTAGINSQLDDTDDIETGNAEPAIKRGRFQFSPVKKTKNKLEKEYRQFGNYLVDQRSTVVQYLRNVSSF